MPTFRGPAVITIQLSYGEFSAVVSVDADLNPDLLDELVTRCGALFLETQAALPDGPSDDEAL